MAISWDDEGEEESPAKFVGRASVPPELLPDIDPLMPPPPRPQVPPPTVAAEPFAATTPPTGRASVGAASVGTRPPAPRSAAHPGAVPGSSLHRLGSRWKGISVLGRVGLVLAGIVTLLTSGGAIAGVSFYQSIQGNLTREDVFHEIDETARPDAGVTGTINMLLLGTDSRDPDALADTSGGGWRTDTIIFLHIPASHDAAYLISLPRDTWVNIPGHGYNKLNAAFAIGGLPLMVETVEAFTNVRIDHTAIIDFAGVKEMTNVVGGVCVDIPVGFTSHFNSSYVYPKGNFCMNGAYALFFVRERYGFADGDFQRQQDQQLYLQAMLDKVASKDILTDPTKFAKFVGTLTQYLTVDTGMDVAQLGWQFRNLRSNNLTVMSSPSAGTGWQSLGGQCVSVVYDNTGARTAIFGAIKDDTLVTWLATNKVKTNTYGTASFDNNCTPVTATPTPTPDASGTSATPTDTDTGDAGDGGDSGDGGDTGDGGDGGDTGDGGQ